MKHSVTCWRRVSADLTHVVSPHTHSGAGTSGGELEEESWQPPDPELVQKLVAQIEYYLSDENLEHDAFLLKHVRRNKLGFVSVKLLTSFKKVTTAAQHLDTEAENATGSNLNVCRGDHSVTNGSLCAFNAVY